MEEINNLFCAVDPDNNIILSFVGDEGTTEFQIKLTLRSAEYLVDGLGMVIDDIKSTLS